MGTRSDTLATPASASRGRRIASNLALAAATMAVVLLVLEGAARLLRRSEGGGKEEQTTALYTEPDPVLGWRKQPGGRATFRRREYTVEVRINAHGLRGPERDYTAPPQSYRLLSLGDSFVEGYGVTAEETATALLESSLGRPGCAVEALNGGTIGYSTDQEYLFYREEGRKYSPKLVLLFFYYNDIAFNITDSYYGRPKPLLGFRSRRPEVRNAPVPRVEPRPVPASAPAEAPTPRGSALVAWVEARLERGAPRVHDALSVLGLWPRSRVVPPKAEMLVYQRKPPRWVERAWDATGAILQALAREGEGDGARLLVVYVPSRMEVRDGDWDLTQRQYGMKPGEWDRRAVAERLAAIGAAEGIAVLDLTEALRKAEHGAFGGPYYLYDGHWNALGHRIAAREIAASLRSRGWLPPCASQ
jgi:hypothetical protein